MSSTVLWNIPEEVVQDMFHLLNLNELLRVRRVCQWTKALADNTLQSFQSRSQSCILIHPGMRGQGWTSSRPRCKSFSLEQFLHEESKNTIRIPRPYFKMNFLTLGTSIFNSPGISNWLEQYGSQTEHLKVSSMNFKMTDQEIEFYERLPNLKELRVSTIASSFKAEPSVPRFPQTFKQLKTLKIDKFDYFQPWSKFFPKLFEFCQTLETFGCPSTIDEFQELMQILENTGRKNFKFLDMKAIRLRNTGRSTTETFSYVCEMSTKFDFKLLNVDRDIFTYARSTKASLLEKARGNIVSLKELWFENDYEPLSLPNLKSLKINFTTIDEYNHEQYQEIFDLQVGGIKRILLPELFSSLRKLTISIPPGSGVSEMLPLMWENVPNVEEIRFSTWGDECPGDAAFMGENGELPFLQLKRLKKLDLGILNELSSSVDLTDASFLHVFRNMKLREFYMTSEGSLENVTSEGILALLTGPFIETIEKFPFHSWSLRNMSKEEFQDLSLKFPNNQPV